MIEAVSNELLHESVEAVELAFVAIHIIEISDGVHGVHFEFRHLTITISDVQSERGNSSH